jgi:hypothetical protein
VFRPKSPAATIQMGVALEPLHDLAIGRLVVAHLPVSLRRMRSAMDELFDQTKGFTRPGLWNPDSFPADRLA